MVILATRYLPLLSVAFAMACTHAGTRPPVDRRALDGCVRVHHLWQRQLAVLDSTAGQPDDARVAGLVANVFRPYQAFWTGYLGDEAAFTRWARTRFTRAGDPRRDVPLETDPGALIADASARMAALARREVPCSDWYVVYGPGWTNQGGLSDIGMVVDFLGMPREGAAADFRTVLPHEVTHLLFGPAHEGDPDVGTLLARIVDEGFAAYAGQRYWTDRGVRVTPAEALGYSDAEWDWALAHERELWALAAPRLRSRERDVIDHFAAAGTRPIAGGPGKVAYFIGYRITEAYVTRHGPQSWRDLFELPIARIIAESGYAPAPDLL